LDDLTINITQNGIVVGTVSNPSFAGNNFCFTIDETDINVNPYGDFEITSTIDFGLDCGEAYNIVINDQTDFEACPPAGCPLPLIFCDDGTGTASFDLTQREGVLTNGWQDGVTFSYYTDENDAFDQVGAISDPANYATSVSDTIYVRTDWNLPGAGGDNCFYLVEMEVQVLAVPELVWDDDPITFCGDGQMAIDLGAAPDNLADMEQVTYEWYKDGVLQPVLGSILTATEAGTYEVVVSNNLECSVTESIVVQRVDFSVDLGSDIVECGVDELVLTPTVVDENSNPPLDPSQYTYLWSNGETTPTITVTDSGTYSVDVTYGICTESATVDVSIAIQPEVSLGGDFEICVDDEAQLTANVANDPGNLEYTWYRDGGMISGQSGSTLSITDPGTYRVEVNEAGSPACFGEDEIVVELYANENCIIPQGISPNGDQYNQTLDLAFLNDRVGISSIEIFNRYGRSVYEKTGGYTNEWFGQTDEGDELGTGTYFYVIKLEGTDEVFDKQVLTGWIYVNRQVN
jgi:gliding motility-associated-like protein